MDPEDDDSDDEAIHVETVHAADKSNDGSLVEKFDRWRKGHRSRPMPLVMETLLKPWDALLISALLRLMGWCRN